MYFPLNLNAFTINIVFLLLWCSSFSICAASDTMQKIETPHFSIGFNKSITPVAQRVANTLETLYGPVSRTLGLPPRHTRLLLNNLSAHINGGFSPMPRHIECYTLYTSDPHFIGHSDWLSVLCIHEFRHAVQYNVQYYSLPLLLRPSCFFTGIAGFMGVPRFFSEGDAVGMETALSKSGRGRLPGWSKLYKVNLLERNSISLPTQLFGSFRYPIPGEYHTGYYLTSYIRNKYGSKAIQYVYAKTLRRVPYLGFYNAIREATGKSLLTLYKEMNQELLLKWKQQLAGLKITPAALVVVKNNHTDHCSYSIPYIDDSGHITAWKKGMGTRDQLVRLKPTTPPKKFSLSDALYFQEKKVIFTHPSINAASVAIGRECAVWLEPCMHPWRGKQIDKEKLYRMRLQSYDFKRHKRVTLVGSCRYNAIAISPNGSQLVVVESKNCDHQLVILDRQDGSVIKKIDNSAGVYYLTPSWCDEEHIVVVQTKNQQNSIARIHIPTGKVELLLPYSDEHRNHPLWYNQNYLLYNSSINGIDNIYAMHLPSRDCFQVTSRKYGAYVGMVDARTNQLIFSDYTKNGMAIAVMDFDPSLWTPLKEVVDSSLPYYKTSVDEENNGDILDKVPDHQYPITPYSFWKDSLGLIGVKITDPNPMVLGGTLIPFEVLSFHHNLKITPYLYYRFADKNITLPNDKYKSKFGLTIKYYSGYPIFAIDLATRKLPKHKWSHKMNVAIKLPYYFTLGSSAGKCSFSTTALMQSDQKGLELNYIFNIKNASTQSERDIHAPWKQDFTIKITKPILHQDATKTSNLHLIGHLYLPGILAHHYLYIHAQHSRKITSKDPNLTYYIKPCYGLPLVYPDMSIPFIWFLKRIYMEGYFSIQTIQTNNIFNQFGIKLSALQHLLSISASFIQFQPALDLYFHKNNSHSNWEFGWDITAGILL
ncbi:MAG: hypothetical protein K2X94_02840 [Amoebophilaceae bacterium]|nr:hypothetical protein [Amoebophilaceae bacterium]